ncbi:MAG: enoyl-CoA hydratase/isomerase family protein [Chloroflexi bacterium]|nr:enoyl-CoA hydratase/isomerase family protein [Chloroflexota bacterium]
MAVITLNQPGSGPDAHAAELAGALADACARLADDDARAVVLTGTGERFATGAVGGAAAAVASLRVPTIAWINGDCLDGGLEVALACDIRVAAPGARLGLRSVLEGRLPADGGTQRLLRLVGRAHALRLLLTGEVIDAAEGLRIGLVQSVGGPEAADELAERVAAAAPVASAYVKEAVLRGADLALEQGLRLEADLSILLHTTADRAKGLASFADGTRPEYEGR